MTSGGYDSMGGLSLFDLFRSEVEGQCATLLAGLLTLEQSVPDPSALMCRIEPLMRAAHSIKGAARVIGLDAIVQLAHGIEDCLVAIQNGVEIIGPTRIDQLLTAVDLLAEVSKIEEPTFQAWVESASPRLVQCVGELASPAPAPDAYDDSEPTAPAATIATPAATPAAHANGTSPAPESSCTRSAAPPTAPSAAPGTRLVEPRGHTSQTPAAAGSPHTARTTNGAATSDAIFEFDETHPGPPRARSIIEPMPGSETDDSMLGGGTVRVSASNLTRLVGLSSEAIVESRRLDALRRGMLRLRETQRRLETAIDQIRVNAARTHVIDPNVIDAESLSAELVRQLLDQSTELEQAVRRSEEISKSLHTAVLASRMRPFGDGIAGLTRLVRDTARRLGKDVAIEITGEGVAVDRDILGRLESPLTHMVRNALDHGIESPDCRLAADKPVLGTITVDARHHAGMLRVEVHDDGRGIDPECVRRMVIDRRLAPEQVAVGLTRHELFDFLFLPGFSTRTEVTEISGRGVGLDVVQSMVQEVGGRVTIESEPGNGTSIVLQLPVSLSVVRAAVADVSGGLVAFPLARLVRIVSVEPEQVTPVQGRLQFLLDGISVGLVKTSELLGFAGEAPKQHEENFSVVVVGDAAHPCGLIVDRFRGEQDLVVRALDERLGKVPHVAAASVLETGEPLLIVDTDDLVAAVRQLLNEGRLQGALAAETQNRRRVPRILVVDDSLTVREVQRQILTRMGFKVDLAVDGRDGWNALRTGKYDLLVSDIDMPRMNGIELIRMVRADARLADIPIIVVSYKGREEDRMIGLDAGANAYLTKGSFHDDTYVRTVTDLIDTAQSGEKEACALQSSTT